MLVIFESHNSDLVILILYFPSEIGHQLRMSGSVRSPVNVVQLLDQPSKVWRYFLVEGDDINVPINKCIVYCSICYKRFNTKGRSAIMRNHLRYKHKEVFRELINDEHMQGHYTKRYSSTSETRSDGSDQEHTIARQAAGPQSKRKHMRPRRAHAVSIVVMSRFFNDLLFVG